MTDQERESMYHDFEHPGRFDVRDTRSPVRRFQFWFGDVEATKESVWWHLCLAFVSGCAVTVAALLLAM